MRMWLLKEFKATLDQMYATDFLPKGNCNSKFYPSEPPLQRKSPDRR